jgi:VIT1/CCC1 family predicted Fe2+/Mn2+ transporter
MLDLNTKRPHAKKLRASEFPEPADVYICDKCERDITAHLHVGHAHVQRPLGPSRYVCRCGQKYLSGAVEWDELSDWEKQRRLKDVGLSAILVVALAGFAILVQFAVAHRSITLIALAIVVVLLAIPVFPLFIAILEIPFEIGVSLWRTRVGN